MASRKNRKLPKKKLRYVIKRVDPVQYAEEIAKLLHDGFGEDAGARPTTFIGTAFWLALVVGTEEIAGIGGMLHSTIEEGTVYLNRSYVLPEHRGHGLQKKLILARCARGRELKAVFATSDTYQNPPSVNNLISCGFRAYTPANLWRGSDPMYWRLALGPKSPRRLKL